MSSSAPSSSSSSVLSPSLSPPPLSRFHLFLFLLSVPSGKSPTAARAPPVWLRPSDAANGKDCRSRGDWVFQSMRIPPRPAAAKSITLQLSAIRGDYDYVLLKRALNFPPIKQTSLFNDAVDRGHNDQNLSRSKSTSTGTTKVS